MATFRSKPQNDQMVLEPILAIVLSRAVKQFRSWKKPHSLRSMRTASCSCNGSFAIACPLNEAIFDLGLGAFSGNFVSVAESEDWESESENTRLFGSDEGPERSEKDLRSFCLN